MVGLIVDSSLVFALPVSLILFLGWSDHPCRASRTRRSARPTRCVAVSNWDKSSHRRRGLAPHGWHLRSVLLKALSRLIGLRLRDQTPLGRGLLRSAY